jgi:hypothetical protein
VFSFAEQEHGPEGPTFVQALRLARVLRLLALLRKAWSKRPVRLPRRSYSFVGAVLARRASKSYARPPMCSAAPVAFGPKELLGELELR